MTNADPWSLTARWVLSAAGPPLPGGVVTVHGDRIAAVEPHGVRRAGLDLGDAIVLPGLVNAHTHLDLSGFRQPLPAGGDFPDWLGGVIERRRSLTPSQVEADVRAGLAECLRHGVTLIADISAAGASWPVLAGAPVRAVVFHELIGLPRERAALAWAAVLRWLRDHPATLTCRPGLSPHAPYSVRSALLRAAAARAAAGRLPLTVHLAESRAELDLLAHHEGPFVPFLQRLGVWEPVGLAQGVHHVLALCADAPCTLFAHGNHLTGHCSPPPSATVVYCPRTHAHFGHPPHPFRDLLARGVRVALGTDSRASNPDLDLLAEARFLHRRHPDLPGDVLLHMVTRSGAASLGWADEAGSLEAGKSADLVVVPLPPGPAADPFGALFGAELPPERVLFRGRWLGEELLPAGEETASRLPLDLCGPSDRERSNQ